MLKKILIGLLALILIFVVVVALQPGSFAITRKATIASEAKYPFELVNNFHNWGQWSPWEKIDPNLKRTYAGPEAGVGAKYAWEGNDDVGSGNMTITESKPGEVILIRLEFVKPFAGVNPTEFKFTPDGANTTVTWTMKGEQNFIGKAICLFMNMDTMVGEQFEKGLADMKRVSEMAAKK
jgi:hypothetical protein